MADTGPYHIPDATNVFALIFDGSTVYNDDSQTFVTAADPFTDVAELADCAINLLQPGSVDLWTLTIPDTLVDTTQHRVILFNQSGGTPALSDLADPLHQFTLSQTTPTALVGGNTIGPFMLPTGSTVFCLVVSPANAIYDCGLDDAATYIAISDLNLDAEVVQVGLTLNEIGSTGLYFGTLPDDLPAGNWVVVAYEGSPTIANLTEGRFQFYTDPGAEAWDPDDSEELPEIPTTGNCLLDAINTMISVIGEAPLTSVTPSTNEIAFATAILNETNKEVQSHGWTFNSDLITMTPDPGTKEIAAPSSLLALDPVNPDYNTSILNDKLYNNDTRSYEWEADVDCRFIRLVAFCSLPWWAKNYIIIKAARRFQARTASSQVLHQYTLEDERDAQKLFMDRDSSAADDCIFNINFPHPRPY